MSADRRSKTRLANAIGAEQATLIYRALVEHQCAEIPSQWEVRVYFTPVNAEEEMRNAAGASLNHWREVPAPS